MLQVALGAVLISFSAVFVELADVGPTMAGFYRALFGGMLLLAAVPVGRGRGWGWGGPGAILLAAACGLVFAADLSFWHRSINCVGPGLATILANFQVFFMAAVGVFVFRERGGWRLAVAVPMSMAGLVMLVGLDVAGMERLGVVFGLATAACYVVYLLVLRKVRTGPGAMSPVPCMAAILLVTALAMGLEGWIQGESFRIPDARSWAALVVYGLFGATGWVLISSGVARVAASAVGLLLLLQPTLAFVWDILFFGRPTGAVEAVGAALALAAIYIGSTVSNK